ncbi:hypothetical protein BOX15_Mlig030043g1 [Macrostomum lignano]|uniref:PID domain-containing protein n=1 Tax=Macrostomum lignano TaxID=282301 RepID=A0A267DGY9_9PLAT|nr:hypothetical protein BOX15_Mlig030043g1 [Macrostomum lignano]
MSDDYTPEEANPMHPEEAFHRGIQYEARYIGSMDVARPQSRTEIVAAMRRVRFEFKAKAAKKRKVVVAISLDGVSLIFKRPPKPWHEGSSLGGGVGPGCGQLLMHHPIYRIFYVSHDSQDLKIFSYIARDSHRNAFKCNVFKAAKKVQAVRIVRTIGQAFEICHQLSLASKEQQQLLQQQRSQQADAGKASSKSETAAASGKSPREQSKSQQSMVSVATETSPSWEELQHQLIAAAADGSGDTSESFDCQTALWRRHSRQLMQQQLEHRAQQTQTALAEVQLLRDQLAAESAARTEAQSRAQRLLDQNRDLLDHLNQLVHRTRALELRLHQQQLELQQPRCSAGQQPPHASLRVRPHQQQHPEDSSLDIDDNGDVSPDSGHKEMSSDSLSQVLSLTLESATCQQPQQQRAAALTSVQQRRTVQTPASLDCRRPHSWRSTSGTVVSASASTSASAATAAAAAAASSAAAISGPAAACWSEQFAGGDEPVGGASSVAAAHLNHSFEWNGEIAAD